eukprot:CAMPEP_0204355284 /NCGR_PEP_ID=MMETSP0469-20131031/34023_1 /ASSEMBLY_ACC=CAM_ASM_000384 /TAXON_ID=2969 /ORGANISM="Oxyrrhis marina" /LENGTH=395 /DNA_ID=CAMNT_0051342507 /DNA_START=167 /DNA_END=1354 /DNA_ORIENTATION=-
MGSFQPFTISSSSADLEMKNRSASVLKELLLEQINVLLIGLPLGIASGWSQWGDIPTFWLNFIALVPLAKLLGDATDQLAEGLQNDTLGGLLNACFGNAVEMIITIQAVNSGFLEVVKNSLIGSILSNLLLVLGMAFFCGGVGRQSQQFKNLGPMVNITMLFLAVMAFSLPTIFHDSGAVAQQDILRVSRINACLVLVGYGAYLIFQLLTHVDLFQEDHDDEAPEDDAPAEEDRMSVVCSTALLLVTTVLVAISSQYLVHSIDGLVNQWHFPQAFVGVVLLPIIGNACEHASAVRLAIQDKPVVSIMIAVGSSTQIALLVMPFAVIAGWCADRPLDLNLGTAGISILFLSVTLVFTIVTTSNSNWLEGFFLMLAYLLVGILYWFTPNTPVPTVNR